MSEITRGDNTAAFGGTFLTISLRNTTGLNISRAEFACGSIRLSFENPVFPLTINLSEQQTAQLCGKNDCFLAVWDEQGRKRTCEGTLSFPTLPRKV